MEVSVAITVAGFVEDAHMIRGGAGNLTAAG
jgi:hypothetical protein